MKKEISEERFRRLTGFELGRELIGGAIEAARGRNLAVKKAVYEGLTEGQRALFSFWVMYGHVQEGWLAFFQSGYGAYLPMMRKGLRDIGDQDLLDSLDRAEELFREYERGGEATARQIEALDRGLDAQLAAAMGRLEALIRMRPQEFVVFSEGEG